MVKDMSCLIELSKYDSSEATFWKALKGARAGRPPPMSPVTFAEEMRRDVASGELGFTAKADMEMVIEQVRPGHSPLPLFSLSARCRLDHPPCTLHQPLAYPR